MNVNFHDTPRHMLQIRQITLPFTKRIYHCAHVVVKTLAGLRKLIQLCLKIELGEVLERKKIGKFDEPLENASSIECLCLQIFVSQASAS